MFMEDQGIISLFFARDERAIAETRKKYGPLCMHLAGRILGNHQDAEECVDDAYFGLWNTIPPERPTFFQAFLCKIVRNFSLKRLEYNTARKRCPTGTVAFEELENLLPYEDDRSEEELGELINRFLHNEKPLYRQVFLRKYWFFDSIEEIAQRFACSESAVKSMLMRTRKRLKTYLEKEGIGL